MLKRIRVAGGEPVSLHPRLTVVRGIDRPSRRALALQVARALRGEQSDVELEVDLDGRAVWLTPDLAREWAKAEVTSSVAVFPDDLPGARSAPAAAAPAPDAGPPDTAEGDAEAELVEAARALREAERELDQDVARIAAAIADAERRLAAARAETATVRRRRDDAAKATQDAATRVEERAVEGEELDQLRAEHATLEAERARLVRRMSALPDPGAPDPIEEALRRLRAVQPLTRPSAQAAELADRWSAVLKRLADLPAPPQPPEWLVIPALAALQEARAALSHAESGAAATQTDARLVDALERAHREVLDAEQRAMRKGSRLNRRRLDQAHQAERTALAALGVATYGEYLQLVAPGLDVESTNETRLSEARDALADAEAVWEELHGGEASADWTRAKEEQAAVRAEALELLGREVPDDRLANELRRHTESVVDRGPAEEALAAALARAGHSVAPDADVEAEAVRWLDESPRQREQRSELAAEVTTYDRRLASVAEQLADHQADAFFGESGAARGPVEPEPDGAAEAAAVADAEAAEAEAEAALEHVRKAVPDTAARVDALRKRLEEAESGLAQAREAPAAAEPGDAAGDGESAVDLTAANSMEVEVYLHGRLTALRAASTDGGLPMLFDSASAALLPSRAARRVLALLARAADATQIVVLGDDGDVAEWARGFGDGASVEALVQ